MASYDHRSGSAALASRAPNLVRIGDVRVPDSATARDAESLAFEASSPMLYGHALRSYFFAALLAEQDGLSYDLELLYVGCVLHDLGLTPDFDDPVRPFEHVSADAAAELSERRGWELRRRYELHRAIVMHMAPSISPAEQAEVLLLEAGVACDVAGIRSEQVGERAIAELLRQYPRHRFQEDFAKRIRREAERKPDCAAALLIGAGLEEMIADAPF